MTAYRQPDAPSQDEPARLRRIAREAINKKADDIVARFEKLAGAGSLGGYAEFGVEFNHCAELRDGAAQLLRSRGFLAYVDSDGDLQFSWSGEPPTKPWWAFWRRH